MDFRLYTIFILALSSYLFGEIELYSNKSSYMVGEHIEVYFSDLNATANALSTAFCIMRASSSFKYSASQTSKAKSSSDNW